MSTPETPERIPFEGKRGWGVALFIVVLTAACWFAAYEIHHATYKNPRDPTFIDSPRSDNRL